LDKQDKAKYYEHFGKHLDSWIIRKFKSKKDAAFMLDCSPTYLSQVVNCHKKPSPELQRKLESYGFDHKYFDIFYTIIHTDQLDKSELVTLIHSQNTLIESQSKMLKYYYEEVQKLRELTGTVKESPKPSQNVKRGN
jgi:hypothetical protein